MNQIAPDSRLQCSRVFSEMARFDPVVPAVRLQSVARSVTALHVALPNRALRQERPGSAARRSGSFPLDIMSAS